MATVTPFALRSPDEFVMNGYLTKPRGAKQPLPMVVIPHGGPIGVRDEYLFNREAQFFAHHGYAVLQVNFRGSGGFGYDYMRRGYGQWGSGMVYLDEAVGTAPEELRSQSPVHLAQNIRAPVFLIHGGRDRRAPPAQAEAMRQALQAAGSEPLWMFQRNEGHGFYNMENRTEFYDQLLAFITQHTAP